MEDILFIHEQEIQKAGGASGVRGEQNIQACTDAPKASFDSEYLNDLFDMAASYIICLTIRHPFVDGNKRTALASALTFLYISGYEVEESYDLELADLILDFLSKNISKEDLAKHLKENALKR
ncbi:type II toxin-antitoxin system death-on-curing family toxin [Gracilimonas sediminicola]|uniref:type II toxin-antitoxin system death-on-curing family toxin n=1 Tax=Gracilimonas sediminicola TaxID=2952158 RepID=UPI0038D4CF64